MNSQKFRDLTLIDLNTDLTLVIACDSAGGIGNKEQDVVKTTPEVLGYYITAVALSEILAFGAQPISIINTLAVEMDNTGERIIEGIKKALLPLGLSDVNLITGSTEENVPTVQTGIGITVIGTIDKQNFKQAQTLKDALAVVIGLPKVGDELMIDAGKETMSISVMLELKKRDYIQEILPVGSKGILFEAKEMARTNGLQFVLAEDLPIDIYKSGGPATCAILSLKPEEYERLVGESSIPVNIIGRFVSP